jgi:hypothetical protein
VQVVFGLDVFGVGYHHSGDKTSEGGDTVSLSDTELVISETPSLLGKGLTTEVSTWVAPASSAA